jgi:hypothetical protein
MHPIFAINLPHGSEWIIMPVLGAMFWGVVALLIWKIVRRK